MSSSEARMDLRLDDAFVVYLSHTTKSTRAGLVWVQSRDLKDLARITVPHAKRHIASNLGSISISSSWLLSETRPESSPKRFTCQNFSVANCDPPTEYSLSECPVSAESWTSSLAHKVVRSARIQDIVPRSI